MVNMGLVPRLSLAGLVIPRIAAQFPPPPTPLEPQTNTFNSNFALSEEQVASLNLSDVVANNVNIAKQFEETNWATGSVLSDAYYTDLPQNTSTAPPGSVLKVEDVTDIGSYTIAPTLSLSRIIYQSETLNGTTVPVSAYILWPYLGKATCSKSHRRGGGTGGGGGDGAEKIPLVSWGHGNSGSFAECGPSHVRNLWYQFGAPYTLALQGYAVVGTDFAGLGVPKYPDGSPIVHQSIANPAAGNDLLYAAQAAHAAFPDLLTEEFVVLGHSQGGGAAWGAAQQQVTKKMPGYLGTVAISPITNATAQMIEQQLSLPLLLVAQGIASVFPDQVAVSDILQPFGVAVANLMRDIQGCNSAFGELLNGLVGENPAVIFGLVRDEFLASPYLKSWQNLTVNGGREIAGPLMVVQSDSDPTIPYSVTSSAVELTCQMFPDSDLEYVTVAGVGHVSTVYATQQIWLDWIEERFLSAGCPRKRSPKPELGCRSSTIGTNTPRPSDQYSGQLNYFLEYALNPYQVA